MRSKFQLVFWSFLSFLLSFQLFALERASSDTIEQYMQASGITDTIDSLPSQLDSIVLQSQITSLDTEVDQNVVRILADAWDTVDVKTTIGDYIRDNASASEIQNLLNWRQGELAQKFVVAELAATNPNFTQDFLHYVADLQVAQPDKETRQAVRRVIIATNMVKHMVDISLQVSHVMTEVFTDLQGTEKEEYLGDMQSEMKDMRESLTQQMESQVVLTSFYLYRNISTDELNQYAAFFESELGKRETDIITESLSVAISAWAKQAAQDLVAQREFK